MVGNLSSQDYQVEYHVNQPPETILSDVVPDLPVKIDSSLFEDLQIRLLQKFKPWVT
jgi:hypothetical protein